MSRVTLARLEAQVKRINILTGSPLATYTKHPDGTYTANPGNFHLDGAYGGYTLYRVCQDGHGVENILQCGHVLKPKLSELLDAFIRGLETKCDTE